MVTISALTTLSSASRSPGLTRKVSFQPSSLASSTPAAAVVSSMSRVCPGSSGASESRQVAQERPEHPAKQRTVVCEPHAVQVAAAVIIEAQVVVRVGEHLYRGPGRDLATE